MKKIFASSLIVFSSLSAWAQTDLRDWHKDLGYRFEGTPKRRAQSERSFVGALKTLGMGAFGGGAGITLMRISPSLRRHSQFSEHVALVGRNWAFYSRANGKVAGEKLIHIGSVATGLMIGAMGATTAYLAFGNNPRHWGRRMMLASATSGVIWGIGLGFKAGARGAFIPGLVSGLIAGAAANTFTEFLDR